MAVFRLGALLTLWAAPLESFDSQQTQAHLQRAAYALQRPYGTFQPLNTVLSLAWDPATSLMLVLAVCAQACMLAAACVACLADETRQLQLRDEIGELYVAAPPDLANEASFSNVLVLICTQLYEMAIDIKDYVMSSSHQSPQQSSATSPHSRTGRSFSNNWHLPEQDNEGAGGSGTNTPPHTPIRPGAFVTLAQPAPLLRRLIQWLRGQGSTTYHRIGQWERDSIYSPRPASASIASENHDIGREGADPAGGFELEAIEDTALREQVRQLRQQVASAEAKHDADAVPELTYEYEKLASHIDDLDLQTVRRKELIDHLQHEALRLKFLRRVWLTAGPREAPEHDTVVNGTTAAIAPSLPVVGHGHVHPQALEMTKLKH
jgi:hypothetical protein